jgi:hypothetical protein
MTSANPGGYGEVMPTPGSHSYDVKRTRLRDELDNSGTPDKNATEAANAQLQEDGNDVQAPNDRAYGPKGER